jgi:hypothetical protein
VFQIKHEGLEEANMLLEALAKIAKVKRSADLNSKTRQETDSVLNNAEIFDFLARGGRDFVTPSKKALSDIDKAALAAIEKGLLKYKVGHKGGRITNAGKMTQAQARGVQAKALVAAAQVWMKEITRRINDGDFTGDGDPKLEEEYEKWKQKLYGYAYPIGKATGQLLDNVAPGTRNIKIRNG